MALERQFVTISEEDLLCLDRNKDSASTKRTVTRSVKLFHSFLGSDNANFEELSKNELNNKLRMFFASIRTVKGEELKKSSLHNIKYGLSKYIKETCKFDISSDNTFSSSMKTFQAKLKDLQHKGKGSVNHKDQITDNDLQRLNDPNNVAFNIETPCGLQNKVWFDIMFHLCRRGRENQRQMRKSTFAVETDTSGREYVRQVIGEADKNHGAASTPDDTIGEGRMYAQGGAMCPVMSFKAYTSKLHPLSEDLWQRPRDSFCSGDNVWYYNCALGKNSLANMMSNISVCAKLSKRYTNHCIRATSISALDRAGFEARHIIRATGHKSETSIKSYSRRLTEGTQQKMSDALSGALIEPKPTEKPLDVPELSVADRMFSNQNEFSEIELPTPAAAESTALQCSVSTTNYHVDHQMNVAQIIPNVTQNFPQRTHGVYCYVAPNISNCTVNFYLGNQ